MAWPVLFISKHFISHCSWMDSDSKMYRFHLHIGLDTILHCSPLEYKHVCFISCSGFFKNGEIMEMYVMFSLIYLTLGLYVDSYQGTEQTRTEHTKRTHNRNRNILVRWKQDRNPDYENCTITRNIIQIIIYFLSYLNKNIYTFIYTYTQYYNGRYPVHTHNPVIPLMYQP